MRINRFFIKRTHLTKHSSVRLEDSDIKHIRKVLRLKKGDKIQLFNNEREYLAELAIVSNDFITAEILEEINKVDNDKIQLTLFQGLLKSGKFDFIVEKATELGVDQIVPVECEYSQMKSDSAQGKIERWNKIAVSASKQSERIKLPQITDPIKFNDIETLAKKFDRVILFTIPREKIVEEFEVKPLAEFKKDKSKNVAIIIGPEGGFSPSEHKLAKSLNIEFFSISQSVLKSETASIVALGLMGFLLN